MRACFSCGRQNPDQARSCERCGARLEPEMGAGHVRKSVTVLFTDVVASTDLGAKLDPESSRFVMGRFFDAARASIERHGGTLEKYIGDAIMAVFGIPVVHEDDPLRACRAGVEILERLEVLNKELERDFGVSIVTRTGINSGEVVAGEPGRDQMLVTGDPVVTSARLEDAAEEGVILLGESTYRLVRDAVTVERLAPIEAKGMPTPLTAYRLDSISPGVGERTPRLVSPLVGRERELQLIRDAFDRSLDPGACTLVTVIGDPGVGKSRLVREAVALIADRATILRGRCLPYGEGITFWPIVEVVREAAGITDDIPLEEAIARIEGLLPETPDRGALRDRVAAAVGLSAGAGGIHETFWALRHVLEEQARRRPSVVILADIHWAEPTVLDLIEYLGERIQGSVLIVCLARPELLDARSEWRTETPRNTTITLAPLGREENDRLIENLLGGSSIPASVERSIAETAEGNPLFVEEMLGMLIDEGRLILHEGEWVPAGDVSSMPAPKSVQSVLAARIDRLPIGRRSILQHASVIGRVFWWGAVAHLRAANGSAQVGSDLRALVRSGLLEPEQSTFAGEDAFKFRHILIRDAAYGSLPKALRATLHERFADWIERAAGERADEYEEILGYHLEQAFEQRLSVAGSGDHDLAFRAVTHLAASARRAFDRDDIKAALNLSSRASQLCSDDDPRMGEIRLLLADSMRLAADPHGADDVLAEVERWASDVGDRGTEWLAKVKRAELLSATTNVSLEELTPTINRAIDVFTRLGNDRGLSETWSLVAWIRFNAGRARQAGEASERAAAHAHAAGYTAEETWSRLSVASHAAFGDTPVDESIALCRSMLEGLRGQLGFEANLSITLGRLEAMRGNFESAREAIERARSIIQDLGVTHGLAGMTDAAADVAVLAGDSAGEEQELRYGYQEFRRMEAGGYQATWAALLARNLVDQGRDDEAFKLTLESETLGAPDDITAQVPWRGARARVLAHRGEGDEAVRLAREGVSIAEPTDFLNTRGEAHLALADVLISLGRPDEAAAEFRRAQELFERKGNLVQSGWARDALEHLGPIESG